MIGPLDRVVRAFWQPEGSIDVVRGSRYHDGAPLAALVRGSFGGAMRTFGVVWNHLNALGAL